jgi:hypothetical protein
MSKDDSMLITQVKEPKEKAKPINLKVVDPKVRKALQDKADTYADGNLSEWLRFAGLHYVPSKDQLVPKKTKPKKKK